MNTGDLIAAIAADGAARPPSIAGRMAVALGIGGLIALALFMQSLGARLDIADALQTWRFATKVAILLVFCTVALWAAFGYGLNEVADRKQALTDIAPYPCIYK